MTNEYSISITGTKEPFLAVGPLLCFLSQNKNYPFIPPFIKETTAWIPKLGLQSMIQTILKL